MHGRGNYGKRPHKITEEEQEHAKPTEGVAPVAGAMPIYSQEELDQIAAEEEAENQGKEETGTDETETTEDYDKYYDDDNK
jgi:hypothetical protein